MVLWEITLVTAYFLGLRRTYRLAIRSQRCLLGRRHPDLSRSVHRRIRTVFDVAVRAHRSIQDSEAGKGIGNSIRRWFDKVKSSVQSGVQAEKPAASSIKFATANKQTFRTRRSIVRIRDRVMRGRSFFTRNIPMKNFPTIAMMMRRMPTGWNIQYRHTSQYTPNFQALEHWRTGTSAGVFRKDIAQWMLHIDEVSSLGHGNFPVHICHVSF